jgi:hypothetical protein
VIAARNGDYRPMETAPLIEREDSRVDPDKNPLGICRAEVRAWKGSNGHWHPVAGEAWWDEYAPLREERELDDAGRLQFTGRKILEPSWMRMGRVMIAKCAEAQALRRGWPDVLSGLYGEEELHALRLAEQTASELLKQGDENALRRHLGKRTLWFIFDAGGSFQPLPVDRALDRLGAFYQHADTAESIVRFNETNRMSLQTLWEWAPIDAFALKELSEARLAALGAQKDARAADTSCSAAVGRDPVLGGPS